MGKIQKPTFKEILAYAGSQGFVPDLFLQDGTSGYLRLRPSSVQTNHNLSGRISYVEGGYSFETEKEMNGFWLTMRDILLLERATGKEELIESFKSVALNDVVDRAEKESYSLKDIKHTPYAGNHAHLVLNDEKRRYDARIVSGMKSSEDSTIWYVLFLELLR